MRNLLRRTSEREQPTNFPYVASLLFFPFFTQQVWDHSVTILSVFWRLFSLHWCKMAMLFTKTSHRRQGGRKDAVTTYYHKSFSQRPSPHPHGTLSTAQGASLLLIDWVRGWGLWGEMAESGWMTWRSRKREEKWKIIGEGRGGGLTFWIARWLKVTEELDWRAGDDGQWVR